MLIQSQKLYAQAIEELKDNLVSQLGDRLETIIVYGSVAREESTEESDIDVMIISPQRKAIYDKVFDIGFQNDLKYDTLTTFILYTPDEFKRRFSCGEPLIIEVLKEGRAVYGQQQLSEYQRALQTGH